MTIHSTLQTYDALGWSVVSGDITYVDGKKKWRPHSSSWQTDPVRRDGANGYAIRTGQTSNVTAIDIDDLTLPRNQELARLCEEAGAIKQNTRKGCHYLFQYTERLRHRNGPVGAAIDIRNEGGLLFCEPSFYHIEGRPVRYAFQNLPDAPGDVPLCPESVIDCVVDIMVSFGARPENRQQRRREDQSRVSQERTAARTLENAGVGETKTDEATLRDVLQSISQSHADNYGDWVTVGMALHHAGAPVELFEEFSQRSAKYVPGEPPYVYERFGRQEGNRVVTTATLFWWLKKDNPDAFKRLVDQEGDAEYLRQKEVFEQNNFYLGKHIVHRQEDGEFIYMGPSDARNFYANVTMRRFLKEKMQETDFLSLWLKDKGRLSYEKKDFRPDVHACPPKVYNTFKNLRAERMEMELSDAQVEELVAPVLELIDSITFHEPAYFLKWMANIVQTPWKKTEVGLVFRDRPKGMFSRSGGTGKNLLVEFFGRRILGNEHFHVISNNEELYDKFSELLENKLLVLVEEAGGATNRKHLDALKAALTKKFATINRKGQPKYVVSDHTNFVFTTNNANPIPVYGASMSDRRFAYFDVDGRHRGNQNYFNAIASHLERDDVARAFYLYLMRLPTYTSPAEFSCNRPMTSAFIDIRRRNASSILQWLVHRIQDELPTEGTLDELYVAFEAWYAEEMPERQPGDKNYKPSKKKFSEFMGADEKVTYGQEVETIHRSGSRGVSRIHLDREQLRRALILHHYMPPDRRDVRDALIVGSLSTVA